MEFAIIQLSDNQALNLFFSFPVWTCIISLPFVAVFNLLKKVL
ncbi:hypothetical protein ACMC56_08780 [Campylobacterota bacterium DY0563]